MFVGKGARSPFDFPVVHRILTMNGRFGAVFPEPEPFSATAGRSLPSGDRRGGDAGPGSVRSVAAGFARFLDRRFPRGARRHPERTAARVFSVRRNGLPRTVTGRVVPAFRGRRSRRNAAACLSCAAERSADARFFHSGNG